MKLILTTAISGLCFLGLSCSSPEAGSAVDKKTVTDSIVSVSDSIKTVNLLNKPLSDTVSMASNTIKNERTCDIELLNSYELTAQHKVYVFYIHAFQKESKECWYGMLEHVFNHDVNDQAKYKCITMYILDMSHQVAEKYSDLTEEQLTGDLFLMEKTISCLRHCEGGIDKYEVDPYKYRIYRDPIPPGWTPGDE